MIDPNQLAAERRESVQRRQAPGGALSRPGPLARPVDETPRLFTPADAAALLAVPESWLRRKAGLRLIPCTLLGKHLRFSVADLAAIAGGGSRPTREPRTPRRHR